MIPNITRGSRMSGLMHYLASTDADKTKNAHTDPHLVASWERERRSGEYAEKRCVREPSGGPARAGSRSPSRLVHPESVGVARRAVARAQMRCVRGEGVREADA